MTTYGTALRDASDEYIFFEPAASLPAARAAAIERSRAASRGYLGTPYRYDVTDGDGRVIETFAEVQEDLWGPDEE